MCVAEVNNDVMATAQLMGTATTRITVATWIANIYLRHPYVCAQGAASIADAIGGRFILGLGVSHQPVPTGPWASICLSRRPALPRYVTAVRSWLRGEGPATHIPQRPAVYPVPVYVAAPALPAVELGGELANGIMPFLWSAPRVTQSKAWLPVAVPRRPTWPPSISRSACRLLLARIWTLCATQRVRTWRCSPRSPSSSACSGPWGMPTRPPSWNAGWARMRRPTGFWMQSACSDLSHAAGNTRCLPHGWC